MNAPANGETTVDVERLREVGAEAERLAATDALAMKVLARLHGPRRAARPWGWALAAVTGAALVVGAVASQTQPTNTAATVAFGPGAELTLAPGARASASGHRRARIDRGRATATLDRRSQGYVVEAGPFAIQVLGTRFTVAWDPDSGDLSVTAIEGSLVASGGGLASPRTIAPGETLHATAALAHIEAVAPEQPQAPTASDPARTQAPKARGPRVALSIDRVPPKVTEAPEDWRGALASERYGDAVGAAERVGLGELCKSANIDDLVSLGDAARLAGHVATAERSYGCAHARGAAPRAAFGLGLVSFEAKGDFAVAARWFDRYLAEQPRGPLAAQAAGRALEAWDRAGDRERARRAADAYLDRYPTGSHAGLAQRISGRR